jgi:Domain of unknown function (DUF4136)
MRTTNPTNLIALALGITMIGACASVPTTRIDRDPQADLKSYKTFGFYELAAAARPQYATIMSGRLKRATREQLERLGYTYSEEHPDLRVNYVLNVQDRQELRSTTQPGFFGYRGWAGSGIETVNYRQGTLAIDLVDAQKNALVWRGVAEGRISAKDSKQPGATVDAAVNEIFVNFPNGAAK